MGDLYDEAMDTVEFSPIQEDAKQSEHFKQLERIALSLLRNNGPDTMHMEQFLTPLGSDVIGHGQVVAIRIGDAPVAASFILAAAYLNNNLLIQKEGFFRSLKNKQGQYFLSQLVSNPSQTPIFSLVNVEELIKKNLSSYIPKVSQKTIETGAARRIKELNLVKNDLITMINTITEIQGDDILLKDWENPNNIFCFTVLHDVDPDKSAVKVNYISLTKAIPTIRSFSLLVMNNFKTPLQLEGQSIGKNIPYGNFIFPLWETDKFGFSIKSLFTTLTNYLNIDVDTHTLFDENDSDYGSTGMLVT